MTSNKINRLLKNNFVRYCIIGACGVTIDFLSYMIIVGLGMAPVLATVISTSLGITNNFLLNSYTNFNKRDRILSRFTKFYSVGLLGIGITAIIVYILHDVLGLSPLLSKVISIPPVVILQFLLNKNISFSDASLRERLLSLIKRG